MLLLIVLIVGEQAPLKRVWLSARQIGTLADCDGHKIRLLVRVIDLYRVQIYSQSISVKFLNISFN